MGERGSYRNRRNSYNSMYSPTNSGCCRFDGIFLTLNNDLAFAANTSDTTVHRTSFASMTTVFGVATAARVSIRIGTTSSEYTDTAQR